MCDDNDGVCISTGNDLPVIIVGSGLAGLSASIEAYNSGARIILIEKEPRIGGNSAKATSGINGAGSKYQKSSNTEDDVTIFIKDTLSSGHGLCDEGLVKVLADDSSGAIDWLSSFGIELSNLVQMGGHSRKRTHREPARLDGKPSPVGFNIVSALRKHVESLIGAYDLKISADRFALMTETHVTGLISSTDHGSTTVEGVQVATKDGNREDILGTVVLTTGGYANDHTDSSLLEEFKPDAAKLPTTNGPFATGEGVKMGRAIGAKLMHMDQVQIHPTGFIESSDPHSSSKFLAPEALRGSGGILVNGDGKRFVNELGRRDDVTAAIFEQKSFLKDVPNSPSVAYMILSEAMCEKFGLPNLGFYKFKKLVRNVESVKALAEEIGAKPEVLADTLETYGHGEDPFGKPVIPFKFSESDNLWVAIVTPAIHYTMGGLSLNSEAAILSNSSEVPINGLFGAGEVTAGVHGGNRLGGNSLLECVVFGRIAGKSAASFSQKNNQEAKNIYQA
eukprot:CFRG7823T1